MMSTSMPRRSSAARMRAAAALAKALSSGWATTPQKDQVCACQEPREKACEAWEHSLGFDPRRDQAGGRPRRAQTAQGCNDRRHHEGDWLAAALGPRLLCGCGTQEARLDTDIGEGRGRTRLSCACRPADQIEAEDRRTGGRLAMASVDTRALEGEIDRIRSLGLEELRREWRRLYHSEPPRISRDLLVLALGYRLQEIEHGGLGKSTRRKLQTMAKALRTTGRVGPTPSLSLKPGARLVREWRGRTHTVTVTEDGFEYAGENYPSLTKIAKKITGAHWSGPRFFGLLAAGAGRPSEGAGHDGGIKQDATPGRQKDPL